MLMRPVHVHQFPSDCGKDLEGRRRAVDELPVRARVGEHAFEDELVLRARLQAVRFKKLFHPRRAAPQFEHRLHGTTLRYRPG